MAIKAKFYVAGVEVNATSDGRVTAGSVRMNPVCRGAANKRWASATPSGEFKMFINTSAIQWFLERVGGEVAITLEDASVDPQTHEYVALEDDYQPTAEQLKQGWRRDETCAECGHLAEAHV